MKAENLTAISNEHESSNEIENDEFNESAQNSAPNTIFIGPKPFMNYVTAVVMQFTTKNANDVTLKARGKFISRAVDIAEISSKRFLENQIMIQGIQIGSEEFQNKEGRTVRVSTIEILLNKR